MPKQTVDECKAYHKRYHKDWYARNKAMRQVQILAYKVALKAEVAKIKLTGCIRCGYNKCAEAIEFHHKDSNKEATISNMVNNGQRKALLAEIKKCDILCANCHREAHYSRVV
jgi:hypothetical protein